LWRSQKSRLPMAGGWKPSDLQFILVGFSRRRKTDFAWFLKNADYRLVNKAKVEPKTVQSILRHSRIQTTLDIYTQGDGEETRAAQGAFLKELGMASELVQ
jgi:integrase